VHFPVAEQVATGEKELGDIAGKLRMDGGAVSKYLATLESLRLVRRRLPLDASPTARGGHWALEDPFLRFWFRFVFPFQADLEAGLAPEDLYDHADAPMLGNHVAPVLEDFCRAHTRAAFGTVAQRAVGRGRLLGGGSGTDAHRSGRRCEDEGQIRTSRLWNVNHVDEAYDPGFVDVL